MDVLSQNLITGVISLTDNGFIILNEFFRFATFALAFLTLLLSFGFYFAITSKK